MILKLLSRLTDLDWVAARYANHVAPLIRQGRISGVRAAKGAATKHKHRRRSRNG